MEGELSEVVVTGTGTPHYSSTAPVRTELITQRDIDRFSPQDFLGLLLGLSASFDASHSAMGAGLTLGGLGNKYILVLVNGKRLYGDMGGQSDLSKIDPSTIKRVEIVKGAASTLYGSDAIAGVINIVTKDPGIDKYKVENTTRYGSYNSLRQSDILSFTIGKWSSATKYSGQRTDGWQNSTDEVYRNKLYHNSTTPTVSSYYNHRVNEEIRWHPDSQWQVYADGMLYLKKIMHPSGAPRWRSYNLRYNDQAVGLGASYQQNDRMSYSLDASFDRHAYYYDYYNRYLDEILREEVLDDGKIHFVPEPFYFLPGQSSVESDERRWIVNAKASMSLSERHTMVAGSEVLVNQLYAPRRMAEPFRSATSLSLYAQDEWQISPEWNVTGGIRYLYHQAFGSNVTPKVSFHYNNTDLGIQVRGGYSMGYKTPTIKELYYEYERTMMGKLRMYLGNPNLKPETSHFVSIGGSYSPKRNFTLHLNASYNALRDMIVLVPTTMPNKYKTDEGSDFDTAMQYTNGEKAGIKEIEATITYQPLTSIKLATSYSYTDAWADVYDEKISKQEKRVVTEHRRIDGTSAHKATAMVSYMYATKGYDLTISLSGRGQSDRYYRYYGTAPGYVLANLSTLHQFKLPKGFDLKVSLGVDNLFDYKETHPYGYNFGTTTPGRTYYAGITIGLQRKNK